MNPRFHRILLLALLISSVLHAQQRFLFSQQMYPLRQALSDTSKMINEDSLIARAVSPVDTVIRPGKSTTVALLASALAPGVGQIYNESYWKAPVVWGIGYYFVSVYRQQNSLYRQYRDAYRQSVTSILPEGDSRQRLLRDFYRGQRDTFGWYIAIAYLVNVLDAYVDASLYNFEVSPNLQPRAELRLVMRIPLK